MIIKNVNRKRITEEFNENGIYPNPILAINKTDIGGKFTFDEKTDMELVEKIIQNHDPKKVKNEIDELQTLKEQVLNQQIIIDELMYLIIPSILEKEVK